MISVETPLLHRSSLSHLFWRENHDLVKKTLNVPFVQSLYDGSLSDRHLTRYYQQDEYFQHIVRPYRRFIKDQKRIDAFDPNDGIKILKQQKKIAEQNLEIQPSLVTKNYINYILTNVGNLSTAATSLLPCSKLYRFLTNYLSRLSPSSQCTQWISSHTYNGYRNNTSQLESIVNQLPIDFKHGLSEIYRKGFEHEVAFFSQFSGIEYE